METNKRKETCSLSVKVYICCWMQVWRLILESCYWTFRVLLWYRMSFCQPHLLVWKQGMIATIAQFLGTLMKFFDVFFFDNWTRFSRRFVHISGQSHHRKGRKNSHGAISVFRHLLPWLSGAWISRKLELVDAIKPALYEKELNAC